MKDIADNNNAGNTAGSPTHLRLEIQMAVSCGV